MTGGFRSRSKSGGKKASSREQGQQGQRRKFQGDEVGVDKPRQVAFEVLRRVLEEDAYANLTLPRMLSDNKLDGRDAAFATELTYGTLRSLGVVDAVIAECSSRPLEQIESSVLQALRLGAYQLLYTRVEPHAAVDTSVKLVDAAGQGKAKGFANAILRTISRGNNWVEKVAPKEGLAAVAFEHAHPEWIAASFAAALGGEEELEAALAADSERPRVHLVARPGEISAEELAMVTGGEEGKYSPYAVYLESGDPGKMEPVRDGLAAVQDEGSQMVARAVTEVPVDNDQGRWLDLCAGPGGKAALMGAIARIDGASVEAVEISEHRATLIEKTARGLPVKVHVADGRDPDLEPGYDRVLVDAPCSGLGALRRRPEARWRKEESDIHELSSLQFELLKSALGLVKPGGAVVYSTCSPDLRETRAIVDRAVSELGAVEIDAHSFVSPMENTGSAKSVQMWPHRHGTDAMFMAVLRRGELEQDA